MSITEALVKAYSLLNTCDISARDAGKVSQALNLLEACINALTDSAATKEESK